MISRSPDGSLSSARHTASTWSSRRSGAPGNVPTLTVIPALDLSGTPGAAPSLVEVLELDLSGTVTAVGTTTVTIKTSTATTAYTVTTSSDIDKNGEATLSALTVGDAVTYIEANKA